MLLTSLSDLATDLLAFVANTLTLVGIGLTQTADVSGYLAYLLLIPRLGFFSCSLVAAVFFLWFLGVRKLRSLLLVPCIILICVHLLIERGLRFDLPDGLLF